MATDQPIAPTPESRGFIAPKSGGFVGLNGPIYIKDWSGPPISGFQVEERHCNPFGLCHGGWLSTFADVMLARQVPPLGISGGEFVTVSLSVDFVGAAKLGDWVEGQGEVIRKTKKLVFVQGIAQSGERMILRTNCIFQRLER